MDYKKFFWATKEKIALTLVLFILLNIFFFPLLSVPNNPLDSQPCGALNPETGLIFNYEKISFIPLWKFFQPADSMWRTCRDTFNWQFEIVYLGFSYLAACIVFHMKNKGGK